MEENQNNSKDDVTTVEENKTKMREHLERVADMMRMVHWLGTAVIMYLIAFSLFKIGGPEYYAQVQTVCWKLGHITIASFFGYRMDISIFRKRITAESTDSERLRRAIMVVGAMIAVSLGG